MVISDEGLFLPFKLPCWENVVQGMQDFLAEFDNNPPSLNCLMNFLQQIRLKVEVDGCFQTSDDVYSGLIMFLSKVSTDHCQRLINISFKHVLYYSQMIDRFFSADLCYDSNNSVQYSLAAVKSLLACSVLCLIPMQFYRTSDGCQQLLNLNFDELYTKMCFKSQDHENFLKAILEYFSEDPKIVSEIERKTKITFSLHKSMYSDYHIKPIKNALTWPLVLQRNSLCKTVPLSAKHHFWTISFKTFLLSNFFNRSNLGPELSVCIKYPFIIPLFSVFNVIFDLSKFDIVHMSFDGIKHTFLEGIRLDFLNPTAQYSLNFINKMLCKFFQALQISQETYNKARLSFASSFTHSIIEDALVKLNSKERRSLTTQIPSGYVDFRKYERSSLTTSVLPWSPRRSKDSSTSRSTRQSYSSSRSGSLQMSSISSRRSSNRDSENNNVDKVDLSSHGYQPIIVEESGNHIDDELSPVTNCLMQHFDIISNNLTKDDLMTAPISDLKKMSLTKGMFTCGKLNQYNFHSRRNSSPTLGDLDISRHRPTYCRAPLTILNRCCEVDSHNDLFESNPPKYNFRGRRQSLPCHLRWINELPLTDSVKISLSRSVLTDGEEECTKNTPLLEWPETNFEMETGSNNMVLFKLSKFADNILSTILPATELHDRTKDLSMDILRKRDLNSLETIDTIEDKKLDTDGSEMVLPNFAKTLQSQDFANFDKELFSSTFFDDEAFQCFRKLSNLSSSSSSYNWTPHLEANDGQEFSRLDKDDKNIQLDIVGCFSEQMTNILISDIDDDNNKSLENLIDMNFSNNRDQLNSFADCVSVDIIADTFSCFSASSSSNKNELPVTLPVIHAASPSSIYDPNLMFILQLLAVTISQYQKNQSNSIVIVDSVSNSRIPQIIELLCQKDSQITPNQMYSAIVEFYANVSQIPQTSFDDFLRKL